jgi:hypothetical protein
MCLPLRAAPHPVRSRHDDGRTRSAYRKLRLAPRSLIARFAWMAMARPSSERAAWLQRGRREGDLQLAFSHL